MGRTLKHLAFLPPQKIVPKLSPESKNDSVLNDDYPLFYFWINPENSKTFFSHSRLLFEKEERGTERVHTRSEL